MPNQPQLVKGRPVVWETCATMNNHWGFCKTDSDYKSAAALTAGLVGCVSQNGNLLLNIGPDAAGRFPELAVARLQELAAWNRSHGEAVTGCGKSKFRPPFGACYTQKGNTLYCYFLQAPIGDVILPELKGRIEQITLLRTGENVEMVNNWGFELLRPDEQRIRPAGAKVGDVLKMVLR